MNRYSDRKSNKPLLIAAGVAAAAILLLYYWFFTGPEIEYVRKAVVVLTGNSSVSGEVTFEQSSKNTVTVTGSVRNLAPFSLRGFHVHELGDLTQGCLSTGAHFNPGDKVHGARTDATRHVGDLGNIASDEHGTAIISFTDNVISLNGPKSIIGRAVVVHEGEDDLGKGGNEGSLKTGNAGGRAACGVIGRA